MTLWIATLFTANLTSAFWTWPTSSQWCVNGVFPNCSDYPKSSTSLYFANAGTDYNDLNELNYLIWNWNSVNYDGYLYSMWKYYTKATSSNWGTIVAWKVKTFNDWDFLAWRVRQNDGSTFYGYVSFIYNFINYTKDWDAPVFSWWYDLWKKYNSIAYYSLPELPAMNNTWDYFYFNQPRHWSWIFYNYLYDVDLKTVQYIWNQVLTDKFIYVDSLATSDNIWLVDTNLNKAWSMTETDINVISDFMFWGFKFTDEVLNNAGWTDSYTVVLNTGWNSFLPQTYWNFIPSSIPNNLNGVAGSKSYKGANIGLTYQKDFEFVNPNYWSNSTWNINTGAYDTNVRTYQECIRDNTPIYNLSHMWYKCLETVNNNPSVTDEDFLELFMYIERLDYYIWQNVEYTWYYPNTAVSNWCGRWVNYAESIYPKYTTWNYHDLALIAGTYVDTDWYDLEVACWSYPNTSSEQSRSCTYLGIGCDGFSMGMWYDTVKSLVWSFRSDTIWQLDDKFLSWYNSISVPACTGDYYWKSYGWANTAFLVFVSFLIFELYLLFKN